MKISSSSTLEEGKSVFFLNWEHFSDHATLRNRTAFDPTPKVHGKPIDLFDLFQNINARGGYDRVSAEKLLWRKIAGEFDLNQHHAAASAFGAKTVYYKYLAYVVQ